MSPLTYTELATGDRIDASCHDGNVLIQSAAGVLLLTEAQARWLLICALPALLAYKPDSEECAKTLDEKTKAAT